MKLEVHNFVDEGFYLIRMYDESGKAITTDSYFCPNDPVSEMMAEAYEFRDRINKYSTPYHIKGEIEYIEKHTI
jgi:hypothetical protein